MAAALSSSIKCHVPVSSALHMLLDCAMLFYTILCDFSSACASNHDSTWHVSRVQCQRMQLCSLHVTTALRHTVASAAERLCLEALAELPLVQAREQTV